MERLRQQDESARRAAQRHFEGPLVLEAGAGTGKTSTLIARIVVWSMGPGWERALRRGHGVGALGKKQEGEEYERVAPEVLRRVAAITFTDAAAAEIEERVCAALEQLVRGTTPEGIYEEGLPPACEERRARARALRGAVEYLVVRTIHGYCRRLLGQFPLEAGIHPRFQVDASERAQHEVIRAVVEEALRGAYSDRSPGELLSLVEQELGPAEIEEALRHLVSEGIPAEALRSDPFSRRRVQAHCAGLSTAIADFQQVEAGQLQSISRRSTRVVATLDAIAHTRLRLEEGLPDSGPEVETFLEDVARSWSDDNLKRLRDWSRGRLNASERESLGDHGPAFSACAARLLPWLDPMPKIRPERTRLAFRVLAELMAEVEEELRRRGIATFASLLRETRDLLRRRSDVRRAVRSQLDQLLVDEFQDTDPVQCEIVRWIALDGPVSERPGLFLVGDPKQSIYGWRSADLAAYDSFLGEVERAGAPRYVLCVNFRSAPAILEEVRRVVSPVMSAEEGLQPPFQPLVACQALADSPGYSVDSFAPVEYWLSWRWDARTSTPKDRTSAAESLELEARSLAHDFRRLHEEQGEHWRDMAVLIRSTGDLDSYLNALRHEGIPYAVERDRSYSRRREVIEVSALVRCILEPHDHLALLTLLRSATVGVPDAALIPLWTREFPRRLGELAEPRADALKEIADLVKEVAAELPDEIPGIERVRGWEASLIAAVEAIAELRASFHREDSDRFVERMRELVLMEATEGARHLGAFRAANLDRFFRELQEELAESGDPQALLRRLRSDVARDREAQQEPPRGSREDAVRVMTIHKAKGLDFRHVYLVQLHKRAGGPAQRPVQGFGQRDGELEGRLFGVPTLGYALVEARRARIEAAERVRTLYVAMTRAKERLVMLGNWDPAPVPIEPEQAVSHVQLLASRDPLPDDLPRVMAQLAERKAASYPDEAGVRWVFPDLPRPPIRTRRPRETAPSPRLSVAEVERGLTELAALQDSARRRMERPWHRRASQKAAVEDTEERATRQLDGIEDRYRERRSSRGSHSSGRRLALAVGTAVHRVLEQLDFDADPDAELEAQSTRLPAVVEALLPGVQTSLALREARQILKEFAAGPLWRRLWSLRDCIIARELPVWLPPSMVESGSGGDPVGFASGMIDLAYRHPEEGALVVADYKTDRVDSEQELQSRAEEYRDQGRLYAHAIRGALQLEALPRFELWFLRAGRTVWVPVDG